jgi:hypothetical protein
MAVSIALQLLKHQGGGASKPCVQPSPRGLDSAPICGTCHYRVYSRIGSLSPQVGASAELLLRSHGLYIERGIKMHTWQVPSKTRRRCATAGGAVARLGLPEDKEIVSSGSPLESALLADKSDILPQVPVQPKSARHHGSHPFFIIKLESSLAVPPDCNPRRALWGTVCPYKAGRSCQGHPSALPGEFHNRFGNTRTLLIGNKM